MEPDRNHRVLTADKVPSGNVGPNRRISSRGMPEAAEHYHALLSYPSFRGGNRDEVFRSLDAALSWIDKRRETFETDGYAVTETSVPSHERAGVVRRYHVADSKEGATVAILVVRSCIEASHV
jgi:hypothetical protein